MIKVRTLIALVLLLSGSFLHTRPSLPVLANSPEERPTPFVSTSPTQPSAVTGPEFQISPDGAADRYGPEIAFNWDQQQYLVVWENRWPARDIYGQRVDGSGSLVGANLSISTGSGDRSGSGGSKLLGLSLLTELVRSNNDKDDLHRWSTNFFEPFRLRHSGYYDYSRRSVHPDSQARCANSPQGQRSALDADTRS